MALFEDYHKGKAKKRQSDSWHDETAEKSRVVRIRRMPFYGESCSCSRITLISDATRNHFTKHDVRQSSEFYPAYSGQMSNSYSPAGEHDASHLWRTILNYRWRPRISVRHAYKRRPRVTWSTSLGGFRVSSWVKAVTKLRRRDDGKWRRAGLRRINNALLIQA